MKLKSGLVTLGLVLLLIAAAWVLITRILPGAIRLVWWVVPFLLMIAAIISCMNTSKSTNIKILWILVCIFAPIIGPILWFLWGKKHT
jgi:hypothetical protein